MVMQEGCCLVLIFWGLVDWFRDFFCFVVVALVGFFSVKSLSNAYL